MILRFHLTWVLLAAILASLRNGVVVTGERVGHSIPGATQTISGYDTEEGFDAICWRSQGYVAATNVSSLTATGGIHVSNPLLQNFVLDDSGVTVLRSCPTGNSLTAYEPDEIVRGDRLRTEQWYNYTVLINLDLSTLHPNSTEPTVVSDQGSYIAVQMLVCQLGRSGFCSPFTHEATTSRLQTVNATLPETGQGESHGGTHVHSNYQYIPLSPNDQQYTNLTVHVPMMINEPGQYFTIAAVQLYLGVRTTSNDDDNYNNAELVRYDVANAIHDMNHRVFTYQSPATILELSNAVRIVSYVVIGISGTIIAGMLYYTVIYRKHHVMKLTQGYFLMLFLFAALAATTMCIFIEPRNDLYCRIALPSILISAQFMYAITLGRLWRINTLISPLLMQTLGYKTSWIRRWSDSLQNSILKSSASGTDRVNLKRKINSKQLCVVIWVITAPQIILQALALVLQTPYQAFEYNSDESIGRAYCRRSENFGTSIETYGFIVFAALVLLLLLVANQTRSLPCLFNETSDILSSTATSLCIFVVGGVIVLSTNSPTTSPALQHLLGLALALSITLNTSVRLPMLSKLLPNHS